MDDLTIQQRATLLRDMYVTLNVYDDDSAAQYREFKRRLSALACLSPSEELVVYGMVCFVLGNVLHRATHGLFRIVDRKRELLDVAPNEAESIASLREEEHKLRVAYKSFCELVVTGLLNEEPGVDFGSEWLFDMAAPEPSQPFEVPDKALVDDFVALKKLSKQLFPTNEVIIPVHPAVTTFIDQVSANFEKSKLDGDHAVIVRIADKSVRVSVPQYCGPTDTDPKRPQIMRINISGTGPDARMLRELELPLHPDSSLNCRLEFSVLPKELSLLATWITEWIKGQEARDTNPPSIPIRLSGEVDFFEFTGDPDEVSPFVEPAAEDARSAFSSGGEDWLDVDYLWSQAARSAFNRWQKNHEN